MKDRIEPHPPEKGDKQPPLGFMVKRLGELLTWKTNRDLDSMGLTHSQMHLLICLHRAPDRTRTLKEMESIFSVAQSTIAGMVCRLEKKELVEASPDENDRRVKRVRLTEKGAFQCEKARKDMQNDEKLLLSRLTAEEQETFLRLLHTVYETLYSEML